MTGINDRGFFRKSTGHALGGRRRVQKEREPLPTRQALQAYVKAVQHLLQHQAQALSARFGVDPQVADVVRQVWFAYVPLCGVLEEAFAA